MTKEKDLVAEMLPTLCSMFMGRLDSHGFELEHPHHAADARVLFDAVDALKREQKIRDYERVIARSGDLRVEMQRAVERKRWKLAQNLAAHLVVELTDLPILELVVLVQEEHKALIAGMDEGAVGFEAFAKFADAALGIVRSELESEELIARGPAERARVERELSVMGAAKELFDNRRGVHADSAHWARLGGALYGDTDPRVVELREGAVG